MAALVIFSGALEVYSKEIPDVVWHCDGGFEVLLAVAINDGFISGFTIGTTDYRSLMVSHLLIVDDTLIFCDAALSQIEKLWDILLLFEVVLGLKIKLGKS